MPRRRAFGSVRKLPSGNWQARYFDGGGNRITSTTVFETKADATRFLAQIEADLSRGDYLDPRAGRITLADWATEWLDQPGKRRTSRARDEIALRRWFIPRLGRLEVAAITPFHVRRAVEVMSAEVAPATALRNLSALRALMNAAVEADLIARSPVRGVRVAKGQARYRPTLMPAELMRLANSCRSHGFGFCSSSPGVSGSDGPSASGCRSAIWTWRGRRSPSLEPSLRWVAIWRSTSRSRGQAVAP